MTELEPHILPGSIFMQPWWLDIVAHGDWADIQIVKGGDLKARWPIVFKTKKGFKHIEMPVLTQKLGPWIKNVSEKQEAIHSNERSVLEELIEKLPDFDRFTYNLDESITNYLPFIWKGFNQRSVTSFRICSPFNSDHIWDNLKSSVRRDIRRARETCSVANDISTSTLYELIEKTFQRNKGTIRYSFETLDTLVIEAKNRNRASLIGIKNSNNEIIAAQLYIHDDNVTYYLAGGFDHEKAVAGAVSYGLFEGIKLANDHSNDFDFEGSSIKGIERFFSSFGSEAIHFHNIQKVSKRYYPIHLLKEVQKMYKSE